MLSSEDVTRWCSIRTINEDLKRFLNLSTKEIFTGIHLERFSNRKIDGFVNLSFFHSRLVCFIFWKEILNIFVQIRCDEPNTPVFGLFLVASNDSRLGVLNAMIVGLLRM